MMINNITSDNVHAMHTQCIDDIKTHDYFQHIFDTTCEDYGPADLITDVATICNFWNDFWSSLPDHPAIRRDPFFLVCDLAEGSYLDP